MSQYPIVDTYNQHRIRETDSQWLTKDPFSNGVTKQKWDAYKKSQFQDDVSSAESAIVSPSSFKPSLNANADTLINSTGTPSLQHSRPVPNEPGKPMVGTGGLYPRGNDPESTLSSDEPTPTGITKTTPRQTKPKQKSNWRKITREKMKRKYFDTFEEEKVVRKPLVVPRSEYEREVKRRRIETDGQGPDGNDNRDREMKMSTNRYGLFESDEEMWGLDEEGYRYHAMEREYDKFLRE